MIRRAIRPREWAAAASAVAQIAATAAGMLPWWALPLTLALTLLVARPPGPVDPRRTRLTRTAGVAGVAIFAGLIAFKSVAAGSVGADPIATLRSLTEALVVLSLVMAPASRTPREQRVWLTVTTGVLVAAAAGGHSRTSATLSILSWIVLLTAMTRVQAEAAEANGAIVAAPIVAVAGRARRGPWVSAGAVIPVAAALVAGAVVFFVLPSGLGGADIAKRIAHHVANNQSNTPAGRSEIGVDTSGDGDLSLLVRGALPTTPLIRVPNNSPSLWRGTFYRTYTGVSWQDDPDDQIDIRNGPSASIPRLTDDPVPVGSVRHYHVLVEPGVRGGLVWTPGVALRVAGQSGQAERILRGLSNVRILGLLPLTSYDVTAAVATTSPARLRAATGADPTNPEWTQLPAELPSKVSILAHQITANYKNRFDQVTALERYLRTHETYTLNSPVPGNGQDAVADFLFRDHTGFCEQFASAEAVMLRTLGVPTRVVSGLAYGIRAGSSRLYTAADAHAWVEVYYPGIGWSPTDPTAGVTLAPTPTAHHSPISRIAHAIAANIPGGRVALVIIMLALILGAAYVIRRMLQGRSGQTPRRRTTVTPQGPVLAAFHRLAGHPRAPAPRAPAETAREYIGRVAPPGQLESAVAVLEQEVYGEAPPDPVAADSAVKAFATMTNRPGT